jgi:hypothetical protein
LRKHFEQAGGDIEQLTISTSNISRRAAKIENMDVQEPVKIETSPRPRLINSN